MSLHVRQLRLNVKIASSVSAYALPHKGLAAALAAALLSVGIFTPLVLTPAFASEPGSATIATSGNAVSANPDGERVDRSIDGAYLPGTFKRAGRQTNSQTSGTQTKTRKKPKEKKHEKNVPKTKATKLKPVMVTGSLIPTIDVETANPVITITAQQIKEEGYQSLYEVLRASPLMTGSVQSSVFTNGATPNASTVSMFGLPPGFTLFLLNGHPISSYPIPYNTESNFTNLSNIPLSIVSRIQILPGNESAIYGSSAIAGVINIITKKSMHGYAFEYEGGDFSPNGGGLRQRATFTGGYNANKFHVIYSLQADNVHPIFGFDTPLTASSKKNPNPASRAPYGTADIEQIDANGRVQFVDPNDFGGCGALGKLFGGSVIRGENPFLGPTPAQPGYYCASYAEPGYATLGNEKHDISGYVHASYQFGEDLKLYADVLYARQTQKSFWLPGLNSWNTGYGDISSFILNQNTGLLTKYIRLFAPEESGGLTALARHTKDTLYNATFGIRGGFGDSDWNYNGYITRSADDLVQHQPIPLTNKINAFMEKKFLGPKLGTTPLGFSIYAPNNAAFFQPITPSQFRSFLGLFDTANHTYTQRANFQVNNINLFSLPAGPVGFAALIEGGSQSWENLPNAALQNGDFLLGAFTRGGGKRNQQGTAVEFHVPVFKSDALGSLDAELAGRYDRFKNLGGTRDSRLTYKIGLAYRPVSTLLLRANVGTAFRAPDMVEVFQTPSNVQANVTDWYKCEKYAPNSPISRCPYNSEQYTLLTGGNRDLKSITAKSFGYGVVWAPTRNFNVHADLYRISIQNEVQVQNVSQLVQLDARCLTANSPLGSLDPRSSTCKRVLNDIKRAPVSNINQTASERIISINAGYVNVANEMVRGVASGLVYRWNWGKFGKFRLALNYNVTFDHTLQQTATEPVHHLLREPQWSSEFRDIGRGTITWRIGKWVASVTSTRYGSTPNFAAQVYGLDGGAAPHENAGRVAPWILYNLAVAYNATKNITFNLVVDNVRNTPPPFDSTWTSWPFFNQFNYSPFGRFIMVGAHFRFGGGGN